MKSAKIIFATLTLAMCSVTITYAQHDHSQMNKTSATTTVNKEVTTSNAKAGDTKTGVTTETFKVSGNCGMCKNTIEKAAKVKGVSKADWNIETKVLTLKYDPSVVTSDAVLQRVADAGYDNEKFKATDKSYKSLDGCCQYDRTK